MADLPIRVRLSRTKGYRMPPNTRVVTRTTIFGNPWAVNTPEAFWWPQDPKGPRWLPQNLGHLPDHLPDSAVFPVDMTAGEIRVALAALSEFLDG